MASIDTVQPNGASSENEEVRTREEVHNALALIGAGGEAATALAALRSSESGLGVPYAQSILLAERMRLAGTTSMPHLDEICDALSEGDRLTFKRYMDNRDDTWSIRVFSSAGRLMGYVPADLNETYARLMDSGKRLYATFIESDWINSWIRVYCKVYLDD